MYPCLFPSREHTVPYTLTLIGILEDNLRNFQVHNVDFQVQ